ncbi:MAG: hypothetical protein QOG45_2321 [Chloroflexota bacterium]|nr:hypothetical protein [Chloroflexota bacterium]
MPERRPPLRLVDPELPPSPGVADALRAAGPRVHLLAASVLIDAGALDAAWEPLEEAARDAHDPLVREELGLLLLRLARGWEDRRRREAARAALRLAAQLAPRRAVPVLARHLQQEGAWDEALALWARAIELDPGEADHHLHHGRLLEARGRHGEAHAAYLRLVETLPTARSALTVAPRLERLAGQLPPAPGTATRIAMLGSATLDQLRDCLMVQAHRAGLRPRIHLGTPDQYELEIADGDSGLHRFGAEVVILAVHRSRLFPELERLPCRVPASEFREVILPGLDRVRSLLGAFRSHSSARVLLHNMVVPQLPASGTVEADELGLRDAFHHVNLLLARLTHTEFGDVHLVDEDAVQGRCGKAGATDPRLWLAAGMPWSESVLMPLAQEHVRHLLAARGDRARSCLVVGLDNTLWRGRVAEDGAGGVELGARAPGNAFQLFQHQLDLLRTSGVRLAICSKADRDAAVALLETHPDMLLRLGDFAATRIGCASKPAGVREIAAELGIGLDSVVFWDDSPEERAQMRAELPQVLTPEVPADPARHRQALVDLAVFDSIDRRERR